MKLSTGFLLFIFAMLGSTVAVGQFINIGGGAQPRSDASTNGYLASSDWTLFNAKQVTLLKSDATHNGYLGSTDWTTFNGKANSGANTGITSLGPAWTATADNQVINGIAITPTFATGGHTGVTEFGARVTVTGGASGLVVDNDQTGPYALLLRNPVGNDNYWYVDQDSNQWSHGGVYADADESKTANTVAFGFANDYHSGMFQPTNPSTLGLSTNGIERVRLTSDGKVGIGTTVPATPLTVYAVGTASGGLRVVSDLTGNPFEIQTAGGTHWMYMDTGSNTWFHGGVYVDEGAVHTGAGVVAYGFGSDYTTGLFQSTHGVLNFSSNGTEAMRLDSSQNLAIGTTTAVQKLTVAGLIKMAVQAAASTPACGATTDGTLAITSAHIVCVCTGTSFVKVSDGSTACTF